MAIPAKRLTAINEALVRFDQECRGTPDWLDWESSPTCGFGIRANDRTYPAKKVIEFAAGRNIAEFTQNKSVNGFFRKAGFELLDLRIDPQLEFKQGEIYDRETEINKPFGGSYQSGIAGSGKTNAIFLFTGASGAQYGYFDKEDDLGIYNYTGEGKSGNMEWTAGNKAIRDHAKTGRALYLFESLGKGKGQKYKGEYVCANYTKPTAPGEDGVIRDIFVFSLVPIEFLIADELSTIDTSPPESTASLRQLAYDSATAGQDSDISATIRTLYKRSRTVKKYVLSRANGVCESCEKPAPFTTTAGLPYLEPHHINRLSDGGLDHPQFIGAICPSCHREIHYGVNGGKKNEILRERIFQKEGQFQAMQK